MAWIRPTVRPGFPAPLAGVVERLVDRDLHGPGEPAAGVVVLDLGDPAHVGDVVAERRSQPLDATTADSPLARPSQRWLRPHP